MPFEQPQKGNPHQLTVRQHTFPQASIRRFLNSSGHVEVWNIPARKTFPAPPDNPFFCAQRTWDQRAESGYMKEIEDIFQPLADAVSRGEIMNIGASDHRKISDFHLLWNLRAHSKNNPIGDQKLKGVSGMSLQLTQDHEEQLEKHNVMFVRNDATIPGRVWEGLHIQMRIDAMRPHMAGIEWGILRAEDGEFVVPDSFGASHLVPISPSIMLGAKNPNATISRDDVAKINEIALRSSMGYVFARDFSKCPYADELLPAATPKKYKQRKKK